MSFCTNILKYPCISIISQCSSSFPYKVDVPLFQKSSYLHTNLEKHLDGSNHWNLSLIEETTYTNIYSHLSLLQRLSFSLIFAFFTTIIVMLSQKEPNIFIISSSLSQPHSSWHFSWIVLTLSDPDFGKDPKWAHFHTWDQRREATLLVTVQVPNIFHWHNTSKPSKCSWLLFLYRACKKEK